jgi:aminoglycoside phosphotransferase (APT) family kinase protein
VTDLANGLRQWVEAQTGAAVVRSGRLGSGASRRTWSVELADSRTVVVREDPGTGPVAGTALTLGREAAVYRALANAPVPVPTLLARSPGGKALLFDLAPGSDELRSATADERWDVACDYGRCLGRLHRLAPADLELGPLAFLGGEAPTNADIALWQSILDIRCGAGATPVSGPALRWLAGHVPDAKGLRSLCHGDAGPGNFLHAAGAVTALLDWEFAHLGDPHDDLAWVAVRNQLLGRPLALDAVFGGWREASEGAIDLDRLEYYRALVLVRMAISCDAALNWTGGETTPDTRVQAALRPFLAPAILVALRRAGCAEAFVADLDGPARAEWERSPIAPVLGDPSDLDDLGETL